MNHILTPAVKTDRSLVFHSQENADFSAFALRSSEKSLKYCVNKYKKTQRAPEVFYVFLQRLAKTRENTDFAFDKLREIGYNTSRINLLEVINHDKG